MNTVWKILANIFIVRISINSKNLFTFGRRQEIWSCADALRMNEQIEPSEINLYGHITVYLDFSVYEPFRNYLILCK